MEKVTIQRKCMISLIFVGVLTTANAQGCVLNMTSLELQPDFDFEKFMGRWFEVKAWFHRGIFEEELLDDFSILFTKQSPDVANVLEMGRMKNSTECEFWTGTGDKLQLIKGKDLNPARLMMRNLDTTLDTFEDKAFYVVATDYNNYALTATCTWRNILYANGTCLPDPIVHALSRTTTLKAADEALINRIIEEKICHADLVEFRPNFHSKPCDLPVDGASVLTLALWLYSSVALISIINYV